MTPAEYRTIRKQLGLTQAGLAALLGETRETVNRRERSESISGRDEFALLWIATIDASGVATCPKCKKMNLPNIPVSHGPEREASMDVAL